MKITYELFCKLLAKHERPVVLQEGMRDLPEPECIWPCSPPEI